MDNIDCIEGKIYALKSHMTDKIYIGSTTQKYLSKRFYTHRDKFKKKINNYYMSSFEIVKFDDVYIELLCVVKCKNRAELNNIERFYIKKNIDKVVNKYMTK